MPDEAHGAFISSHLSLNDFKALGPFAEAGLHSTELALERAGRSAGEGRVPIAGSAVSMQEDGELSVVAVGNNGRIPPPDSDGIGYPTDHGETATIRQIEDVGAVDWSRVVFTTTLSPCIMCTRTLIHLYHRGLDKIVIAEAKSFAGKKDMLAQLPGMTLVELTSESAVRMMRRFSETYPWDWKADIGKIPPDDLTFAGNVATDRDLQARLLSNVTALDGDSNRAGVVSRGEKMHARALDQRSRCGGNPTMSAPMIAMGEAGSAVNLRECVLVAVSPETTGLLTTAGFGDASLGACELFRPAVVLSNVPVDRELTAALEAAAVNVVAPLPT